MSFMSESGNFAHDAVKEVAKDIYADGGKPIVKPTGELVGLVPRAIKAALAPVEKWILQREYNVEETKKLLEEKLKNVPPESIQPPEAYIAVPAFQYISYCMDNEELRDMYASLLANSMNKVVKNGVHPGYIEIIKQLSPDEAKILKIMMSKASFPIITLRYEDGLGQGLDTLVDFSLVGELAKCENPYDTRQYFDNLERLGLIERDFGYVLKDGDRYKELENHSIVEERKSGPFPTIKGITYNKVRIVKGKVQLSAFGKGFCSMCLSK